MLSSIEHCLGEPLIFAAFSLSRTLDVLLHLHNDINNLFIMLCWEYHPFFQCVHLSLASLLDQVLVIVRTYRYDVIDIESHLNVLG